MPRTGPSWSPLFLLLLSGLPGCEREAPPPPPVVTRRFALGVEPAHEGHGIGGVASCTTTFTASEVLREEGAAHTPRIARAGRFRGRCGTAELHFEGVAPARVNVVQRAVREGAQPFTADSNHPEQTLELEVQPQDSAGGELSRGRTSNLARWRLGEGCDRTVTVALQGRGVAQPYDAIELVPLATGSCTVSVEYQGAQGQQTLTIR